MLGDARGGRGSRLVSSPCSASRRPILSASDDGQGAGSEARLMRTVWVREIQDSCEYLASNLHTVGAGWVED